MSEQIGGNYLVIDIGGTFIKYATMLEDMTIVSRGRIPTPRRSREDLINTIGRLYDELEDCAGIAISMAGIIDSDNGHCLMGGPLKYNDDFYLRHNLYKRCAVPIHMENNAKCAAIAEASIGSLRDARDGFVLIFSTMIGGGYVKDGEIHKGVNFSAGEVSYIITVRDDEPTLENIWGKRCSIPFLCKKYAEKKNMDILDVDGLVFMDAVKNEDEVALECIREVTKEIAVQIFNIQTVLNPERFALGGEISGIPLFMESVKKHLKELYAKCPFNLPQASVVTCKFEGDANLYGAMQCLLKDMKAKNQL